MLGKEVRAQNVVGSEAGKKVKTQQHELLRNLGVPVLIVAIYFKKIEKEIKMTHNITPTNYHCQHAVTSIQFFLYTHAHTHTHTGMGSYWAHSIIALLFSQ